MKTLVKIILIPLMIPFTILGFLFAYIQASFGAGRDYFRGLLIWVTRDKVETVRLEKMRDHLRDALKNAKSKPPVEKGGEE